MKLNRVLQIIKEELEDFYDYDKEQSMADKYLEKNTTVAIMNPNIKIDAEIIGYVDRGMSGKLKEPIPVYKNPKNLNGFSSNSRGVLLSNGDFCLAPLPILHDFILEMLGQKGIIPYGKVYDYNLEYPEEFIAVIRIGNTNKFGQSSAYNEFPEYYQEIFDLANKKQPFYFTNHPYIDEIESPLDPNYQITYFPQGYDANLLYEIAKKIGYKL
jgi:hypothetical protein